MVLSAKQLPLRVHVISRQICPIYPELPVPQRAAASARAGFLRSSTSVPVPADIVTLASMNMPMETEMHQPSLFKMLVHDLQNLCSGDH